jgi:hypothetical protein
MRFRLEYVALPVFLLSLAYCSWGWGGVSQLKDLGPLVSKSAQREAPIVATYLWLGEFAIGLSGSQASALAQAEQRFGPARERLLSEPELAMENLFTLSFSPELSWLIRMHWVCPIALLVFLIALWRRPKQVHTVRRSR